MAKKKNLLEKAADAVDKIIHPDAGGEDAAASKEVALVSEKSSSEKSDYESHPKFSKFNQSQGAE